MKKILITHTIVVFLTCVGLCEAVAQAEDSVFVTLLSSPGKTEIVRHPPADDFSRRQGRGKIRSLPSYRPESQETWQVDLRSCDLSSLDVGGRLNDLLQADFDSKTLWPLSLPSKFNVSRIMELGRNPGVRLKAVHRQGITGAGVGVAIIDQALLVDHIEYRDRVRLYEEMHWLKDSPAQMHGPAVASIAVGKTVGVAPQADLYYIAEWHVRPAGKEGFQFELTPLAQAIDRLIAINKMLSRERRIRVISISLGINPRMTGFDLVKQSIANAEREGIYTVYVGSDPFMGLGRARLSDPDQFDSFSPGQFWIRSWKANRESLLVPMDSRCVAAPNGNGDYMFNRFGGASWTVPWVAGLYALACQVKPDITPKQFWEAARKTSVRAHAVLDGEDAEFGHIMNPASLLNALRDAQGHQQ